MDTITHTLFGFTTYGAVNKEPLSKPVKKALLFTALAGSQIPDIDIIMNLTEVGRINEQMWHRGLTHSILLVPLWAALLYWLSTLFWKVKDGVIYKLAFINVLIHVVSDSLNNWGTGLLEPISPIRVSYGTLSIIDFVIWFFILIGFLVTKLRKNVQSYKIYRYVWLAIGIHVIVQGAQGYYLYQHVTPKYEQAALSADFIPWHFTVIGKTGDTVELSYGNIWNNIETKDVLRSAEDTDLTPLLRENPKANVLMTWSPFVVVVDDDERLGVFDPRFYRNGESFLYEFITKEKW